MNLSSTYWSLPTYLANISETLGLECHMVTGTDDIRSQADLKAQPSWCLVSHHLFFRFQRNIIIINSSWRIREHKIENQIEKIQNT